MSAVASQRERTVGDGVEDRRGQAGRIDQRRRPAVVEKEEIAVRGVRVVRVMPHVGRQLHVWVPRAGGPLGELPRIEAEVRRQFPRFVFSGNAVAAEPARQRGRGDPAAMRQRRRVEPPATRRLAQDIGKVVFEHSAPLVTGRPVPPRASRNRTGRIRLWVEGWVMSVSHHPVAIIGSGPAGLTAAIYAARANLAPVVFAGHLYGGQLMLTTEVENFPGFPSGIMGPELMENFRQQAERFGATMHFVDVTKVDFSQRPFRLWTEELEYTADAVIVATGASARWLDIPGEARLRGRGVSTCATCDGAFFREKHIVVVGGGDSAMEEALFLTRFGKQVTVIHRRDTFRASKIMSDRVHAHPSINVIWNTEVTEVHGEHGTERLSLRNLVTDERSELVTDAMFVAIGHDPNTALFRGQLDLDATGYIVSADGVTTNILGVFVAGDVFDIRYKQAITAAGSGCKAALEVEKYLEANHAEHAAAIA
jgi:thioredoxin reductase (NADPH)